jgi:membrane-associated phospholipid phosphatase
MKTSERRSARAVEGCPFAGAAGALDRRTFFKLAGGAALGSAAASPAAASPDSMPYPGGTRRALAFDVRLAAAIEQKNDAHRTQPLNGDEERYAGRIASFTKGLPHNALGEVDTAAYATLEAALRSGTSEAFERIVLGGSARLANPQAAFACSMEGADSHQPAIAAPPAFRSAWAAADIAECYWHALLRDVPFAAYPASPIAQAAAADLAAFSDYRGPKAGVAVTPEVLFRGTTPGDLAGPYVSQFLWKSVPLGLGRLEQRYALPLPGTDYLVAADAWLASQRGLATAPAVPLDTSQPRYLQTARDLGEFVHRDYTYQAFLHTALILLGYGKAALHPDNFYRDSATQGGFVTQGAADMLDMVATAANEALKAAWCQKWLMHRRLRPEAMAGRIHHHLATPGVSYELHPDILNSPSLGLVHARHGTYFLPMAFPEGSPLHPSYPAGHAAIAGACVTVLKAFFDEGFILPDPVEPSVDGAALAPYAGPALTLGGEVHKLAHNIALGRDLAGVHYRSDGSEGILLGEAIGISLLKDLRKTYAEDFGGYPPFTFTGFRGDVIRV